MPRSGRSIFYWRTSPAEPAASSLADYLSSSEIAVAKLRSRFDRIVARSQDDISVVQDAYGEVAILLQDLAKLANILSSLQMDVATSTKRFLAGWRVTEREILRTEVSAVQSDLNDLIGRARCHHVALASVLVEEDRL